MIAEKKWRKKDWKKAKDIQEAADFKSWKASDMSEIFWIHLGKYVKEPNDYSLNLIRRAYLWAVHADKGLANSFYHALQWAKVNL